MDYADYPEPYEAPSWCSEEVVRLREQLKAVTAERDMLAASCTRKVNCGHHDRDYPRYLGCSKCAALSGDGP